MNLPSISRASDITALASVSCACGLSVCENTSLSFGAGGNLAEMVNDIYRGCHINGLDTIEAVNLGTCIMNECQ